MTQPPANRGRFQKGQSGNPTGRPKGMRDAPAVSAFAIVVDRTLTLARDGRPTEISVEEALQQRTYQDALAGQRQAMRSVIKWIAKREQWLARHDQSRAAARPGIVWTEERDPDNADAAMLILGVAGHNPARSGLTSERDQLLLEPWAVEAALRRRGTCAKLSRRDVDDIRRCMRGDAPSLLRAGWDEP